LVSEAGLPTVPPTSPKPLHEANTPSAYADTGNAAEAGQNTGDTEAAGASSAAELARQAALFNQFCNADPAPGAEPLGFVPLDHSLYFMDSRAAAQDSAYQALQAA
jgi:hypothetical protein